MLMSELIYDFDINRLLPRRGFKVVSMRDIDSSIKFEMELLLNFGITLDDEIKTWDRCFGLIKSVIFTKSFPDHIRCATGTWLNKKVYFVHTSLYKKGREFRGGLLAIGDKACDINLITISSLMRSSIAIQSITTDELMKDPIKVFTLCLASQSKSVRELSRLMLKMLC